MRPASCNHKSVLVSLMILACITFPYLFLKLFHNTYAFRANTDGPKVILFWTKYFYGRFPHLEEGFARCPNQSCYVTDDRDYLLKASAVIFHARDFQADDLPQTRTDNQLYVFYLLESPAHTGSSISDQQLRHFFNVTWTYRMDSDVPDMSYLADWNVGKHEKNSTTHQFPLSRSKNNRAMALLSHCKSHGNRDEYISELGKHFPVDIYGGCGVKSCPRESPECERELVGKYSFYLAFENSHCKDYVTEKVMRGYNYGAVPVVYGGANYSRFFPRNSFIDVAEFASPRDLGMYLRNLTFSSEKYASLHEWRFDERSAPPVSPDNSWGLCRLCELLNDPHFTSRTNRNVDLRQWWFVQGNCTSFRNQKN